MFKAHYLQKTWHALSLKCDVSLSKLEKATQAPTESEVQLQKNVVHRHWWDLPFVTLFGMSGMPGKR